MLIEILKTILAVCFSLTALYLIGYALYSLGKFTIEVFQWAKFIKANTPKKNSKLTPQQALDLSTAIKNKMRHEAEIKKKLGKYSDMVIKRQSEHLEMFAAAYLKSTNIEPENAELVQETKEDKIIWYFRKKNV